MLRVCEVGNAYRWIEARELAMDVASSSALLFVWRASVMAVAMVELPKLKYYESMVSRNKFIALHEIVMMYKFRL
jgi:hypothetical protein